MNRPVREPREARQNQRDQKRQPDHRRAERFDEAAPRPRFPGRQHVIDDEHARRLIHRVGVNLEHVGSVLSAYPPVAAAMELPRLPHRENPADNCWAIGPPKMNPRLDRDDASRRAPRTAPPSPPDRGKHAAGPNSGVMS